MAGYTRIISILALSIISLSMIAFADLGENFSVGTGYAQFNGDGGYVSLVNPTSIKSLNVGTVTAWIKADNFGVVFATGKSNSDVPYMMLTTGGFYSRVYYHDKYLQLRTNNDSIYDGEWHFIAWVGDGSILRFYLNGQEESLVVIGGANSGYWFNDYNTDTLAIGILDRNIDYGAMNGTIDDLAVYNRVLQLSEIQQIYSAGIDRLPNNISSGRLYYYPFDYDFNDTSGNNNHGTPHGNVFIAEGGPYSSSSPPVYTTFASDPETTNFSEVDSSNVNDPTLAKDDTKVEWSASGMNLSGADLDSNIIFANNFVHVNSAALPVLNAPANITFRTTSYPAGINSFNVLKDGVLCNPPECIKHSASPVHFEVQGFSNYTTQEIGDIPEFSTVAIIAALMIIAIVIYSTRRR